MFIPNQESRHKKWSIFCLQWRVEYQISNSAFGGPGLPVPQTQTLGYSTAEEFCPLNAPQQLLGRTACLFRLLVEWRTFIYLGRNELELGLAIQRVLLYSNSAKQLTFKNVHENQIGGNILIFLKSSGLESRQSTHKHHMKPTVSSMSPGK